MKRRHVLGALGVSALGAASFGGLGLAIPRGQTGEPLRSGARLPRPYTVPLPIPPVARPVRIDATTDYYELVQREADLEILPGLHTRVLGYDGTFPGPTLVTAAAAGPWLPTGTSCRYRSPCTCTAGTPRRTATAAQREQTDPGEDTQGKRS